MVKNVIPLELFVVLFMPDSQKMSTCIKNYLPLITSPLPIVNLNGTKQFV